MSDFINSVPADNEPQVELPKNDVSPIIANLSPNKIIKIFPCNEEGKPIGNAEVQAMFIDGDKAFESIWQTAFENSNPEHKLPMISANLQSGNMLTLLQDISIVKTVDEITGGVIDPIGSSLEKGLQGLIGRTNLNKVNTQQIFLSTASVRVNATIGFIAFADAEKEVENNVMLLESWTVPKKLVAESALNNFAQEGLAGLFPSEIPPFVSVTIHGRTYAPFVLGNISEPLGVPTDITGNRLNLQLTLSFFSRTAWDAEDVTKFYTR